MNKRTRNTGTGRYAVPTSSAQAAPGDLDPTFGTGGIVTTPTAAARSVELQLDGKIVAAGWRGHGFALARYLERSR